MSRETDIRKIHAAVTLEALEALANKGLLRRAQKDLERGDAPSFELHEAGLVSTIGGHHVALVEAGPAKATCTCPALGVCQHILTACLQLMQEPTSPQPSTLEEWLAYTDADLLAAFGMPTLRAAYELSLAHEVQITSGNGLTARFSSLNAEVIALPGVGIAGIIVRGSTEKRHASLIAAAMLLVRREAGLHWEPPANAKEHSAPAHREDVLKTVASLLEEIVAAGLARLSSSLVERLKALAISAQTADVHRLGLLLRRIATLASDWLGRKPHADLSVIFKEMATAYALAHSGTQLASTGRETYFDVGALDLVGVAAWPWRTASGYEGLTLLFWDAANSAWNTWSDARPRAFQGGFSAVARFSQPGPWEGAESPAQLARSRFRVMNARRNRSGRLSSSTQSKILITGAAGLAAIPMVDEWKRLEGPVSRAVGLRENDPRAGFQIVRPSEWERRPYDPVTQSLLWILYDGDGRSLEMHLPFDDLASPAIRRLEALSEGELKEAGLLGRCSRVAGRLRIHPLALLRNGRAECLYLGDAPPAATPPAANAIAPDEDDVLEPEAESTPSIGFAIGQWAYAAISSLECFAESGVRARNADARQRLEELAAQARQLGLTKLENLLIRCATPAAWLRMRWILAVVERAS